MRTPKKKLHTMARKAGETKPSALTLTLVRQFAKCCRVEQGLSIPHNIFFIN